ncbi:CHASE3 domain-containing protein [Pedobacter sp. MC2016-24]|uniref:CHASE3 domain-containing protein n=1 Tax=Pedobacter sp. MC2016-24 TaxID=2780090 RepID=UPI00188132D1|nr:CHASE3 domain-containing protein [Pedobacter sp. MC2016-24]MBE9601230.1 CHASE3 domain-containing protein [Pedobacter sp. MC2016-24]
MQKIHRSSKRNLVLGFGISLFLLLLSSGISYFSISQLMESQRWVEHTTQVRSALNNLISLMKDAETGQRGYLLTGDDTFLEPYNGAKAQVLEFYSEVQQLTRDNQSQQHDLPLMEKLIEEKFSIIERTISEKKRGLPPTINILVRGKVIMDSTRVLIKVMNTREANLMLTRKAKLNKFTAFTPIFIGFASLIGMLITLFFYRRIQQNTEASSMLEQQLSEKKKTTERQIEVISNVANKISAGDYHVRVDEEDLK